MVWELSQLMSNWTVNCVCLRRCLETLHCKSLLHLFAAPRKQWWKDSGVQWLHINRNNRPLTEEAATTHCSPWSFQFADVLLAHGPKGKCTVRRFVCNTALHCKKHHHSSTRMESSNSLTPNWTRSNRFEATVKVEQNGTHIAE